MEYTYSDFPDIDLDYTPSVRLYLAQQARLRYYADTERSMCMAFFRKLTGEPEPIFSGPFKYLDDLNAAEQADPVL